MNHFLTIDYLRNGTQRQQQAFKVLQDLAVFDLLASFGPVLAGTIPLEIDLPGSDLDILLQYDDMQALKEILETHYQHRERFSAEIKSIRGVECVVVRFREQEEQIELFGHPLPAIEQYAFRHMVQEYRCLEAGGITMRDKITEYKKSGLNTEASFAKLLGLGGDEFEAMLSLEKYSDLELRERVVKSLHHVVLRSIEPDDNRHLGDVIRGCFLDYEATTQGTVFEDPVIDRLYENFSRDRSDYFVLEWNGEVVGGAGIQPLKNASPEVCELQKMYLRKDQRSKGLGRLLMDKCLEFAKNKGFAICYLESLPELKDALRLYEKSGFKYRETRMGDTGYYGCSLYMTRAL
jgi:putative acetyltransferase